MERDLGLYGGSPPVALVSNILTLEILPAPQAWIKERIDNAIDVLDGTASDSARARARRVLLFLNTREAALELAKRLGEDSIDPALTSSPYRKEMLAVMEQRLTAPDQPVTDNYLNTLTTMAAPEELREKKRNEYATKLLAAVMSKVPRARVVSIYTLLNMGSHSGRPEPWWGASRRGQPRISRVFRANCKLAFYRAHPGRR